jgi:preprotein translocase subunit SecG
MGLLTILPSLILMMTSFTRILVVLLDPASGAGAAAVAAQPGADRPGAVPRCS